MALDTSIAPICILQSTYSADGSTHTESNKLYRKVKHRYRPNLSPRQRPTAKSRHDQAALAASAEARGATHRARPRSPSRMRTRTCPMVPSTSSKRKVCWAIYGFPPSSLFCHLKYNNGIGIGKIVSCSPPGIQPAQPPPVSRPPLLIARLKVLCVPK